MKLNLRTFLLLPCFLLVAVPCAAEVKAPAAPSHEQRQILGWTLHLSQRLLKDEAELTARALELLTAQLDEIGRVLPAAAVAELRKVPLWFSPQYAEESPRAAYHPNAQWLKEHGRDPAMVKGVEFTNIRIFESETRRMPNFALHELAHAYHDRVLRLGFANLEVKAAYLTAKAEGRYEKVERQDAEGRRHLGRAYALTNPQEYWAEGTEAYFSRNDFYPFNHSELKRHDPAFLDLLTKLWGVKAEAER